MLVQTYALWNHAPQASTTEALDKPNNDIARFIDNLISRVTYYPSFTVRIASDSQGRLVAGTQPIVQVDEQHDGMVALRTRDRSIWITDAAYHRLIA